MSLFNSTFSSLQKLVKKFKMKNDLEKSKLLITNPINLQLLRPFFLFVISAFILVSCNNYDYDGCDCYDIKDDPKISETKTLIVGPNSLEANFAIQGDNGELIAAGCYAAMTLSFRWADDARAKTNERPPIIYEFTAGESFIAPSSSTEAGSVSDDDIHTFYISVSDNETISDGEPTMYGFEVIYLEDNVSVDGDVLCQISIEYYTHDEKYHQRGCNE